MPKATKSRPSPSRSKTLYNFFKAGSSSKLEPAKPRQGANVKPESRTPTRANGRTSTNAERTPLTDIIVIDDSDDEDDLYVDAHISRPPPTERRSSQGGLVAGRSASNHVKTEVQEVDIRGKEEELTFGTPVFFMETSSATSTTKVITDNESSSSAMDTSEETPNTSIEVIDIPSSPMPTIPSSPAHCAPDPTPTNISTPPPTRPPPNPLYYSRATPNPTPSKFSESEQDLSSLVDEWKTGDDEVFDNFDEAGEDYEEDAESSSKAECKQACPICGTSTDGMASKDVDEHVNSCIDSLSAHKRDPSPFTSSKASSSSSSKPKSTANAFSVLMSGHGENEAWKEAAEAEDRNFRPTKGQPRRKAPFYKVMPGMPIAVDAFRYGKIPGVTSYWLSHAHSDHYTNLSSNWKNGPIYCSITTANLIIHMLDVDPKWVHPLPNDVKTLIPDSGGVSVTVIEANHCPGSSLFLFEGPQTTNAGDSNYRSPFVGSKRNFRYLHCGDFRACPQHVLHPSIKGKHLDQIYLDTTYLNPKYCFPPQPLVIDACAELAVKIVNGENVEACQVGLGSEGVKPQGSITDWAKVVKDEGTENVKMEEGKERVLVVIGTYSIGKERIVKAVAKALNSKVYCDARKAKLLRCQNDPELHALLTSDPYEATIHVVPLQCINSDRFGSYLEQYGRVFKKAVGFRPTGWTYSPPAGTDMMPSIPFVISRDQKRTFTWSSLKPMRNSTPTAMLYGIPYSEHSSFFELTCFALSLSWGKMIATVNVGSATSRGKMMKWFERWESERKKVVRDASYMKRGDDKESVIAYRRVDYW